MSKALIVCTSHDSFPDGTPTGCWLEEVAAPYQCWKEQGYDISIASVKGGQIPLDPASLSGETATKFKEDERLMQMLAVSIAVSAVSANDYDIMYFPGGHGICWDGHKMAPLATQAWAAGKIVCAVCHGPAALLNATAQDGKPLVSGKKVTGFSNSEEEAVKKTKLVPFLLEDELKARGAIYEKGSDWQPFTVTDGRLVTGQNPQSSAQLGEKVASVLKGSA